MATVFATVIAVRNVWFVALNKLKFTVRGPFTKLSSRIATAKIFGVTSPSAQLNTPFVAK